MVQNNEGVVEMYCCGERGDPRKERGHEIAWLLEARNIQARFQDRFPDLLMRRREVAVVMRKKEVVMEYVEVKEFDEG